MNKEVLRLAIPNIISNLSVPLISTVDTALMGREASIYYIGAVGLGSMMFNFMYWSCSFLRMGTTGLTAQAYGKEDHQASLQVLFRSLVLGLIIAFFIIIFQYPIKELGFWLLSIDGSTAPLVSDYFHIRVWSAPATMIAYGILGWYFGMQNAIFPMIATALLNIVNVVVSFLLVKNYGMAIEGVAWGTVIAEYFGIFVLLGLAWWKYGYMIRSSHKRDLLSLEGLGAFFNINKDIFIRTICLVIAFGFLYRQSFVLGAITLAVNQIFLQFTNLMAYVIDGFAFASESLVGKYKGNKNTTQLKRVIKYVMMWGAIFSIIFAGLYWIGGEYLLYIFTDKDDVISAALPFLIWMILYPLAGFASYIWDGVFVGLTASAAMRNTMILSLVAFVASYYMLRDFGNHGLWAAMIIFVASRGILQTLWYKRGWAK